MVIELLSLHFNIAYFFNKHGNSDGNLGILHKGLAWIKPSRQHDGRFLFCLAVGADLGIDLFVGNRLHPRLLSV
jgi:hypothetical protein